MANFEMSVGEYMLSPVITVKRGATLREADQVLHEHGISALAVTDDDGALVGVLSRTDLLAAGSYGHDRTLALPEEKVEKRMTSPALAVDVEAPLSEAAKTMRKERVHRVFVTRDGALAGVLSTRDLMRAVRDKGIKTPLEEVASSSLVKVKAEDPVGPFVPDSVPLWQVALPLALVVPPLSLPVLPLSLVVLRLSLAELSP